MAHAQSSAASEDDYLMTESDAEGGPPRAARRGPGLSHLVTVMVKPSSLRDDELTYPSGPLCALAELLDNAKDGEASHVRVDVLDNVDLPLVCFESGRRLRVVDDGKGMTAHELHLALSIGFTTRSNERIGMYGRGLHLGAFVNGDTLLMGSRTASEVCVGLLALKMLENEGSESIRLALLSWKRNGVDADGRARWVLNKPSEDGTAEMESERLFQHYSPYGRSTGPDTLEALLNAVLEAVPTESGTMVEVYDLKQDLLLLDARPDDILLNRAAASRKHTDREGAAAPALDYSLRAYMEHLYWPCEMRMTLRGVPIVPMRSPMSGWISTWSQKYEPINRSHEAWAMVYYGLAVEQRGADAVLSEHRRGITYYYRGRLIRYEDPLNVQFEEIVAKGVSVCVVISNEGSVRNNLLTPLPHKQGFIDSTFRDPLTLQSINPYRNLVDWLKTKLRRYRDGLLARSEVHVIRRSEVHVISDVRSAKDDALVLSRERAARLDEVQTQQAFHAAARDDPRRCLRCTLCDKFRFLPDSLADAAVDALDARGFTCADLAGGSSDGQPPCDAEQEMPRRSGVSLQEKLVPHPAWLSTLLGPRAADWLSMRVYAPGNPAVPERWRFRDPDGSMFRSRPDVERWLARAAAESAGPVPAGGAGPASAGGSRLRRQRDEADDEQPQRPQNTAQLVQQVREGLRRRVAPPAPAPPARQVPQRQLPVPPAPPPPPPRATQQRQPAALPQPPPAPPQRATTQAAPPAPQLTPPRGMPPPPPVALPRRGAATPPAPVNAVAAAAAVAPLNWPAGVRFVSHPLLAVPAGADAWALLCAMQPPTPLASVKLEVQAGSAQDDPDALMWAVAARRIPRDQLVGEYVGVLSTAAPAGAVGAPRRHYKLRGARGPGGAPLVLDASAAGNELRFVAPVAPGGGAVSCNCRFHEVRELRGNGPQLVVQLLATRQLNAGDRLVAAYEHEDDAG